MEGSCTSLGKASTGLPLVVPLVQLVGEMAAMAVHSTGLAPTGLAPTGLAPCCDPAYCPGRKRRNDLEPKKLHMQSTQMSNAMLHLDLPSASAPKTTSMIHAFSTCLL